MSRRGNVRTKLLRGRARAGVPVPCRGVEVADRRRQDLPLGGAQRFSTLPAVSTKAFSSASSCTHNRRCRRSHDRRGC